tara:strand:+ start:436 stop:702 length:267 start_codon:yes stop_codon:yes gene_type:complete
MKDFSSKKSQDYSSTRFMLFYADDVVEKTREIKNQIMFLKPTNDGQSCAIEYDESKLGDEKFKRDLREKQGIFFDVNVSPESPRKSNI